MYCYAGCVWMRLPYSRCHDLPHPTPQPYMCSKCNNPTIHTTTTTINIPGSTLLFTSHSSHSSHSSHQLSGEHLQLSIGSIAACQSQRWTSRRRQAAKGGRRGCWKKGVNMMHYNGPLKPAWTCVAQRHYHGGGGCNSRLWAPQIPRHT